MLPTHRSRSTRGSRSWPGLRLSGFHACRCVDGRQFALGIGPESFELRGGQVFEGSRGRFFHLAKALTKSQIAAAQRHFGIDPKVAAKVDDSEQEIAQFGFNPGITRRTARL